MKILVFVLAAAAAWGANALSVQRVPGKVVGAWRGERINIRLKLKADAAIKGCKATVSEFRKKNGDSFGGAKARFVHDGKFTDVLADVTGAEELWVTVEVPRGVGPGDYSATLKLPGFESKLELPVRFDELGDIGTMKSFALIDGIHGEVAREAFRDAVELEGKVAEVSRNGRATWMLGKALKGYGINQLTNLSATAIYEKVAKIDEAVDWMCVPGEVNGRRIERFDEVFANGEFGYAAPAEEMYLVEHPLPQFDRPGRPLYVVLHSAGHNAANALNCTFTPGNHDIYNAPGDFFALFLDCKTVSGDWWYGIKGSAKGYALSSCERRLVATIEKTVVKYGIDRERIYLCGNSMGGSGTLGFGLRHGDIFAAVKANVPAGVEHALARLGVEPAATPAEIAAIPDPPPLIDYSGTNDKWFTGHERLLAAMKDRRYPWQHYWGRHGHCNNNQTMLAKNDLIHSFPWTEVRKSDLLPVFTAASSDSAYPLPLAKPEDAPENPGQINAFFRWRNAERSPKAVSVELYLASLKSSHFSVPEKVTADVTLRRTGEFRLKPGQKARAKYRGRQLELVADAFGVVTVPALEITAEAAELTISAL